MHGLMLNVAIMVCSIYFDLFYVDQYTANVLTIKTMDFDHVPNPGIMSP